MKKFFVELFLFVVGRADMEEKGVITFDCMPIGPVPKGYVYAQIVGPILGLLVGIGWCLYDSSNIITTQVIMANRLLICVCCFVMGMAYPSVWTYVVWDMYNRRKKKDKTN